MTIGQSRPPWKRPPARAAFAAALALLGAAPGSESQDSPLLEREDPARTRPRDDAEVSGIAAPPKLDLERLTVRLVDLDTGSGREPVLEIELETLPWTGEVEAGALLRVFIAVGTGPPLELTLRYQESRSARRRPAGGVSRFSGPGRLAALSGVSPGRGVVFRLPVADLPPMATEPGRELRLWALAVQGGGEDRLPDTDDGGPPDIEAEVLKVRLPAP